MAKGKLDVNLFEALEDVETSNSKTRATALECLRLFFDGTKQANLTPLSDKTYHKIYEVLFKVAVDDKAHALAAGKPTTVKTALTRLTACADVIRLVIKTGAARLERKTIKAVVEHIIQTLPKPNGDLFEPLSNYYLKSLWALFEHGLNVELMSQGTWRAAVDFCLQYINTYSDENDGESSSLTRSFSGLGTNTSSGSAVRSGFGSALTQGRMGTVTRQNADDLLLALLHLVSASNVPLYDIAPEIVRSIMRFLSTQGSAVSSLHRTAFSALNGVLFAVREDRCALLQSVAQEAIPIICRFWQGKNLARDEMLSSARDEMLILLVTIHLHLERSILDETSAKLHTDLVELLEVMRGEYARRSDRDRLHLDDLEIADYETSSVSLSPFRLRTFCLRPHVIKTERYWGILQVMAILERLVMLDKPKRTPATDVNDSNDGKHPRKRQRLAQPSDRLLDPIKSEDEKVRLIALQVLPFVLEDYQMEAHTLVELLLQLRICTSDKRGHIASWALLAIASCTLQNVVAKRDSTDWHQLWHIGSRALTFSATCRAAAVELHAILAAGLLQYYEVGEDIEAIITAADIRGPVVLCDSSILLMAHLLHARVTEVPGASVVACSHIIRWLFARWNPSDRSVAAHLTDNIRPHHLLNLLRTSLGLNRLKIPAAASMACGSIAQGWEQHLLTQAVVRYLLLLDESTSNSRFGCSRCPEYAEERKALYVVDNIHFQSTRRLILELLDPKLSDLLQTWKHHVVDRSSSLSTDTFRRAVNACITMLLLMPHFANSKSSQYNNLEANLVTLTNEALKVMTESEVRGSKETQVLVETLLQAVQPELPPCGSHHFSRLSDHSPHLLQFFNMISNTLEQSREHAEAPTAGLDDDLMDLDEFVPSKSQSSVEGLMIDIPRRDFALNASPVSFANEVMERLTLITAMSDSSPSLGSVPSIFIGTILSKPIEILISCRKLLLEIFSSDLILVDADAVRLVERLGECLESTKWSRCETFHGLCLDVLFGLRELWASQTDGPLAGYGVDLYTWFIKVAFDQGVGSHQTQKGIAKLLLSLMKHDMDISDASSTRSARSSLLLILEKGNISTKFDIAYRLPEIFQFFELKDHEAVFVDILRVLPTNADLLEGIALRLFVLAQLASKWATLLRRCIYHIFEVPQQIENSIQHTTRCLNDVSTALDVEGPRELFILFAPQLLYTNLESEGIKKIPYGIFGFTSLKELVVGSQHAAAGLMVMRKQDAGIQSLAEILELTENEVLQRSFTNIMAYSIAYGISIEKRVTSEAWLKNRLGHELFFECVNLHFADTIALLFNAIDLGEMEKYLSRKKDWEYAAKIMKEIKSMSFSNVDLPPNQQPMFRARNLMLWITYLCDVTQYDVTSLYTPALVVSIARSLLDTIHPALGSLHACSVMRKIRVLISLSGKSALQGYPLEMLLQSISAFITDTECADDCFGMLQYLLTKGANNLLLTPSFFAGIALSIIGSLGTFMQERQASTTQNTQRKETMLKAKRFHTWMKKYVSSYNSPALKIESGALFPAIFQASDTIGIAGNADIGTPESDLLRRLLEDGQLNESLLTQPFRDIALSMLCSEFRCPQSFRTDIFGIDEVAIANAAIVWKSCRGDLASKQYLAWAGRVLGRAFSASGHMHEELLQESSLSQIMQLSTMSAGENSSRACILQILQSLTLGQDRRTVGLAEAALRVIVTNDDLSLTETCERTLSNSLYAASAWAPYQMPPSQIEIRTKDDETYSDAFAADAILRPSWLRDLAISLATYVPYDPVLHAMGPMLRGISGFAARAFPFILHLVISARSQEQHIIKKKVSAAFDTWFMNSNAIDKNNLRMIINSILYLRTQPLAGEKSSADRSHWLNVDYVKAAEAATHCGMFKTALLFLEELYSGPSQAKTSRRSSALNKEAGEIPTNILLTIFQNIDDPDSYYGVQQGANLSSMLARLEYEKDGPRILAFRGAQYDSHIKRESPKSAEDVQSLIKALDVLNLSGLSHSLMQSQQAFGMSTTSMESMFNTARKLEQWDIPVPITSSENSVTIYKAFQAIHNASTSNSVLDAINEGLECTMSGLVHDDLSSSALHSSLRTLAVFTEMDEILSSRGSVDFENILSRFQRRSDWMETGRFDDISQILSCRGTTLSSLSEQPRLRDFVGIVPADARLIEVQSALLSSQLNRSHNALQESLSLATSLMDLIAPCQAIGLDMEAAIHQEAASALWDQGEMTSSIGMLQALDKNSSSKNQPIPVGRSSLLSKIGYQVSVARLEKPDQILESYLRPALKELKGKLDGSEAGHVFHQFAKFCDQQLQDADGQEDLERLQKLTKNKRDDVEQLSKMYREATSAADKNRYRSHLGKNKTWLKLDEEELQRQMTTRDEFLRQSLENYLLALNASDDHNRNALRFSALWLEHSDDTMANEAVSKHLERVPSRKFAPLMNQFTSRLQATEARFQQLLFELVLRICTDHPFHGMYQIYAAANSNINKDDAPAQLRRKAAQKIQIKLDQSPKSVTIWKSIFTTNKVYGQFAAEKDEQRYKSGKKIALKDSTAGSRLVSTISKCRIPSPTMHIQLSAELDYSKIPVMVRFDPIMSIASGVSTPKVVTAIASNGAGYKQLVKGGNDDLRQDTIMEQVFEQVSELLKTNRSTRQRDLSIRTYKVIPLSSIAGVIEFVANTTPLHEYLIPAHERYYPKDLKGNQCRKEIGDVQSQSVADRIKRFRSITDRFHPVMRYFFTEKFSDPDEWFVRRLAYTRSTAAISILGHVLGLGDRHGHNILLDAKSGEVIHIDLGVAFEMGRVLPIPELVPFRLTRDIVDGMGITKTEGVFRRCCEFTLEALRKEVESIMTILDVLRYDPLYSWSISPVRLARLQEGQSAAQEPEEGAVPERPKNDRGEANKAGEADRALTVVNKKLSKTLSVTATVNDLINQASDEKNLAVLYSGWAAYA